MKGITTIFVMIIISFWSRKKIKPTWMNRPTTVRQSLAPPRLLMSY